MTDAAAPGDPTSSLKDAALAYARELGWRVFPVYGIGPDGACTCGGKESCDGGKHAGKHPIPKDGHREATTDPAQIEKWWADHPLAGVGLACDVSGVLVEDRDPRNGSDDTVSKLKATGALIDSPVRSLTGGGGTHDFFASPGPGWRAIRPRDRLGIDLKHSGYVILPPSRHASGGTYRWAPGGEPFEFLDLAGRLPAVPPIFGADGGYRNAPETADDEDFLSYTRTKPLGLSEEQIADTLSWLSLEEWCDDRDGWLQVGMALHHEFEGKPRGFQIWNDFSRKSKKFVEADQGRVWKSFDGAKKPVRMATLMQAASLAKLRGALDPVQQALAPIEDDLLADDVVVVDDADVEMLGTETRKIDWTSKLDLNEEGRVKAGLHNLDLIIRNDARTSGLPRLNQLTQEIVLRGVPGLRPGKSPKGIRQLEGWIWHVRDPINGDLWNDAHDHEIRSVIEAPVRQGGYGLRVTDRDLGAAVNLAARTQAFHPIREFLEAQQWDGLSRADFLFIDHLGAEDTPYNRMVARMFLISAVARVYEPGHKFDFAPIIEGRQGKRKSTFIKLLAKHWAGELEGDFHDTKALVEIMQGAWILEIPELTSLGRGDVRTIKAFMSRTEDKVRLAYARRAQVFPRQCVFMGSTNDREYLRDDTGGRRFWPVECHVDEIDTERLRASVDQIWAEALVLYRQMRADQAFGILPLYLSDSAARTDALRIQEDRRIETAEDALVGQIEAWLEAPLKGGFEDDDVDDLVGTAEQYRDATCLLEVWVECLGNDRRAYNHASAHMLGRAMRRINGWSARRSSPTKRFGFQRVYRRALL